MEPIPSPLASTTHFLFQVTDHPESTFKVIHWQGTEAISTSYRYTLSLAASDYLDTKQFVGKDATLSIDRDGEMRLIHGCVSGIECIGELVTDQAVEYQITFESPLYKLNLTRQSRVFLNLDLKGLIEQVLLTSGFTADTFKIDLKTTYPVREYTAQYNETDFNFFSRLLEHAGVFYSFEQQEKQALLVIQDDSAQLPAMPGTATLSYVPTSDQMNGEETVQLLRRQMLYLPESVKRKDHNYRTPETTLLSQASTNSKIPAVGTDYIYGERSVTLEEAEQLARRRQEMYDCQRDNYIAETNCRGMSAGATLTVCDNPQDHYNGDYLVLSVTHKGDQSQAFAFGGGHTEAATGKTYSNEAILIKKDTPYRPAVDRSRIPLVLGTLTARIETTGGDYAYLDDQGRYRLKNLFDTNDTKAGEASHPVRMMQPSAGANYGMHFPLHAGTEVLIACMNGDPDRPIILGAMTNPATTSPVTSANASHHTVRTFAGNELLMDDLADSERINLHTKDQKNILSLDANSDGHKLALRTEEGKTEFYAKKGMSFESGDTHTLITGNDQTITVENKHSLQTNKKDIAFNAGTDIALTAKQNIKLNAQDKDLSLTSGQDLIIESGKDMSVRVSDGDSSYTIQQGSVSIDAAKSITLLAENGPISIEQGGGSVEISDGKLSIRGSTVAIEGSSVAIAGQMAEMMGGGAGASSAVAASNGVAEKQGYDEHFVLLNRETGAPVRSAFVYGIRTDEGEQHDKLLDEGRTVKAYSKQADKMDLLYVMQTEIGIRMMTEQANEAPRIVTPLKSVVKTPASNKQGVPVDTDELLLNHLPVAMDKMGWKVSAQMMRRWFSTKPAYVMPQDLRNGYGVDYMNLPSSQIDESIIKMKWLLSFPRVKPVLDELLAQWANDKGVDNFKKTSLKKVGWQSGKTVKIGYGIISAKELDLKAQVNFRTIGEYSDTFDDLYGAVFKATLKLAVVGKTSRSVSLKKDFFEVEKIGVYMRDTFDFNADWFNDAWAGLGVWSKDRLLSKAEMVEYRANQVTPPQGWIANYLKYNGFVPVKNSDFRKWQEQRNEGGDFYVFSDVLWLESNVKKIVIQDY